MTRTLRTISILPGLLAMAACTVGPDYAGPPELSSVGEGASFVRAEDAFAASQPQLAHWWEALGDPVLNDLEMRALAANPDLAIGQARIDGAAAVLGELRADAYPEVGVNAVAAHARVPGLDLGGGEDTGGASGGTGADAPVETSSTQFYNLGLLASWQIDLFGGQTRRLQAGRAEVAAAEASLADAQVALTSAVAQTYVSFRALRETAALADQAVTHRQEMLALEQQLFEEGVTPQDRVEGAIQAVERAKSARQGALGQSEILLNALAVLVGEAPGAVDELANGDAPPPLPPAQIEIGDPATLLARRPDIRAAERQLAASSARIGLAEAAGLPRISIFGVLGIGGTRISDLSSLDDFAAIGAPMLRWNFLDFGRNGAQIAQAEARNAGEAAQYRKVVLQALQEVEDSLARFRYRREDVAALARIEASAQRRVALARDRFDQGATSRLEWLDAELALVQAQQELASGRAGLTRDFIAVEDALGLGWHGADQEGA